MIERDETSSGGSCERVERCPPSRQVAVPRRVQAVIARSSASFSDGFMNPRVLRGRLLRLRAMRARSWRCGTERSVPLGMYWRSSPLVFSLEPRCQGLWGSQK